MAGNFYQAFLTHTVCQRAVPLNAIFVKNGLELTGLTLKQQCKTIIFMLSCSSTRSLTVLFALVTCLVGVAGVLEYILITHCTQ
jgi:hypothetical protein